MIIISVFIQKLIYIYVLGLIEFCHFTLIQLYVEIQVIFINWNMLYFWT
jgi:hypothetical protein